MLLCMQVQVYSCQKCSIALRAQILGHVNVYLLVSVQQGLSGKLLVTDDAIERFVIRMCLDVLPQVIFCEKFPPAFVACKATFAFVIGLMKIQELFQRKRTFALGAWKNVGFHLKNRRKLCNVTESIWCPDDFC